ncbi:MAG: mandelate racemase/muconate lactonizing enzyme family protein [Promethearchaeota archaeon]
MKEKIIRIELIPVHVPFREAVRKAMQSGEGGLGMAIGSEEEWVGGDFVICRLITDEGNIGLGESYVWLPETGISTTQIIDSIQKSLSKYLLGENPFNIEKINYRMDINVARTNVAKGLLDIACYDLMGKISGLSVCNLIGGETTDEIPLAALISLADVDYMIDMAKKLWKLGYKSFRYKLGKSINDDIKISEGLRNLLGQDIRLRVDYNQAYRPDEAVKAIKAIEQYNIDFAEQPVNINDFLGMAYVQSRVNVPLMAHEGFFTMYDFVNLVEMGAVRVLGLNTERPGGITKALKCLHYAELRGLSTVIHNQNLGIGTATLLHFAAANYNSLGHAPELFGYAMMEDDLITEKIQQANGFAKVPKEPGFGVKLDEKALEKYSTGPKITIKSKN